ncbi:molybdopterin-guanine dinucleotide biosynthesis protein A [Frankia sp. EI5c]|uniref:molybdenum cofactor guanylyltransferase n=1 Tax=Frankia sp. EI5c TaxID=683316 RepID=UPI0007C20EB3|nr:molybdenum cofactor guanylyltransferase [Frankia sp. EI5c]OAA24722.1 molybdopterin-guanine dinucleotide biosynthesis protein A [Frankia sp. EI5c]
MSFPAPPRHEGGPGVGGPGVGGPDVGAVGEGAVGEGAVVGASWDALVLAGGGSRRMGGDDKITLRVGGVRLLDRVLGAVEAAGSVGRIIAVGPPRAPAPGARPLRWTREDPPGGGPVAAIAAGLRLVAAPLVVVLAADLPFLGAVEIRGLLRRVRVPGAEVVLLSDPSGRPQYLAAAWHTAALRARLPVDPAGCAVRSLLAGRAVPTVPASARACLDCDDPGGLATARALDAAAGRP